MPLLEKGRPVEDRFVRVADDAPLPADAPAVISLARLQRDAAALAGRNAELGVQVPSDTRPEELAPLLDRVSLVVVEFPKFRDGRGFTIARTLRERFHYTGELRAVGHILPDQYLFLCAAVFPPSRCRAGIWPYGGRRSAGSTWRIRPQWMTPQPSSCCADGWRWD